MWQAQPRHRCKQRRCCKSCCPGATMLQEDALSLLVVCSCQPKRQRCKVGLGCYKEWGTATPCFTGIPLVSNNPGVARPRRAHAPSIPLLYQPDGGTRCCRGQTLQPQNLAGVVQLVAGATRSDSNNHCCSSKAVTDAARWLSLNRVAIT